tara:strand:- start:11 stop:265 length:255 start_codon:yes stop_codon:yes gene_type:complete
MVMILNVDKPRTQHKLKCRTCKEEFTTVYGYQIYCQPCREAPKIKKAKKGRPKAEGTAEKRRKDKQEVERKRVLINRKYLTMRL